MSEERGLESLKAWQKSIDLTKKIYLLVITKLPPEEKYALGSQLRRASQSIAANIAEGYGRYYFQETIRFCYIARGSLDESFTFLVLANELGYLSNESLNELKKDVEELRRIISGYIAYLKKTKRGEHEPGATGAVREAPIDYETLRLDDSPFLDD